MKSQSNLTDDLVQSLNLPEEAQVHASTVKKSPRLFETKIEVNLWRDSIFCRAIAQTPEVSVTMARRKLTRLISDLHDRKFASKKHMKAFEKRTVNDGAI